MNQNRSRRFVVAIIEILIFATLLLLHYSGAFKITSIRSNPVTVIPFLVAFSIFNEEWASAVMDSSASQYSFFHTTIFMLIGLSSCLIIHYLFNNNVRSAIALSLLATLFYFLMRWLFFHAFSSSSYDSVFYLMHYALPSVIYTNLFIVPFYYLQKQLHKIKIG